MAKKRLLKKMKEDGYTPEILLTIMPEELQARYGLTKEEARAIIDKVKSTNAA